MRVSLLTNDAAFTRTNQRLITLYDYFKPWTNTTEACHVEQGLGVGTSTTKPADTLHAVCRCNGLVMRWCDPCEMLHAVCCCVLLSGGAVSWHVVVLR